MLRRSRIPERDVIKRLLDQLHDTNDRSAAFRVYCDAVSALGFNGVIMGSRLAGPDWKEGIEETSFPPDWVAHYMQSGYQRTDPARRFCLRSTAPFFWKEIFPHFRKKELKIFSEAKEFGLASGLVMPIFDAGAMIGAIGLSSDVTIEDHRLKTTFSIASQIFLTVYHHIVYEENGGGVKTVNSIPALTKREMDILLFLAKGIGNSAISDALYISRSAVEYHLKNIFRKLGVDSRVGAVVRAIKLGLIMPE